jgi:hypothetical protein
MDVHIQQLQSHGIDMTTMARESRTNPTLADGCNPVALAGGGIAAASTAGVLGTGSNPDRTTPGIEAV